MKTDSKEYKDLMKKLSDEAFDDEMEIAEDDYLANEDMQGRPPPRVKISVPPSVTTADISN